MTAQLQWFSTQLKGGIVVKKLLLNSATGCREGRKAQTYSKYIGLWPIFVNGFVNFFEKRSILPV